MCCSNFQYLLCPLLFSILKKKKKRKKKKRLVRLVTVLGPNFTPSVILLYVPCLLIIKAVGCSRVKGSSYYKGIDWLYLVKWQRISSSPNLRQAPLNPSSLSPGQSLVSLVQFHQESCWVNKDSLTSCLWLP